MARLDFITTNLTRWFPGQSIVMVSHGIRLKYYSRGDSQCVLKAVESGTILAEAKDGKYEPVSEEDILRK